jgi:NADH-quinone oxidoreductase subunit L
MNRAVEHLYLIPLFPLLAAAVLAVTPSSRRRFAARVSIGAMVWSFLVSLAAFVASLNGGGDGRVFREFHNLNWFQIGDTWVRLGWVMDPLAGVMVMMVTLVGLLIVIFSVGYMAHDSNFTRFFCFMSLFAAAMLGLVIANSLLLLFVCWEVVGFASYILIGFWFHKPSAAAAAKKAFIVTRIGDLGLLIGMLWLYSATGTLLFYDNGNGCLESTALGKLVALTSLGGVSVSTAIALLIFVGAVGKSGQVPLHVWLPDAMEGPTPVSALIHAATMVAAGVFLVARVFPVFEGTTVLADAVGGAGLHSKGSLALIVVAWTGAVTAVFAALIAVAQTDIKRILAYSTVSQLGYMFLGLGVGGVAVALFHLITHAFFKALLFLGSGSVIHGCHDEQDIRRMGGLRKFMPVTFATYAVGMMALCGVPLFFSGFWSKDEIMHAALNWEVSRGPFYLGVIGALLTAFYMTRQMCYVFFGNYRGTDGSGEAHHEVVQPHESPGVMTVPLIVLATGTILLSLVGTPIWPWFHHYLGGQAQAAGTSEAGRGSVLFVMLVTSFIAAAGIWLGWSLYGKRSPEPGDQDDTLQSKVPRLHAVLAGKFRVDEFYAATVVRWNDACAQVSDWFDRAIWGGLVKLVAKLLLAFSWFNRFADEVLVDFGFDQGCGTFRNAGRLMSLVQNGQVQRYLRIIGLALAVLALVFIWGLRG